MSSHLKFCLLILSGLTLSCNLVKNNSRLGSIARNERENVIAVSDFEGQVEPFQALITMGILKWTKGEWAENSLDFQERYKDVKLLIDGDFQGRGTYSIRLRQALANLQTRYPGQVFFIIGNWEASPLGFMQFMPEMKNQNPSIREDGGALLLKWLEEGGQLGNLEFHQRELAELSRRTVEQVTLAEAAQDLYKRLIPGGEFFEFLKKTRIALILGNTFINHGGVSRGNFGKTITQQKSFFADFDSFEELNEQFSQKLERLNAREELEAWVAHLEQEKTDELQQYAKQFNNGNPEVAIKNRHLARYLDAIYDPAIKRVQIHASSLIYGIRQKEGNDLRLPEKALQAVFNKAGICLEVVGHTPVGSGAMVLRAEEKFNFMRLHVDTSFTKVREHSLTVFNPQNCQVIANGQTEDGVVWSFDTSDTDSKVGLLVRAEIQQNSDDGTTSSSQSINTKSLPSAKLIQADKVYKSTTSAGLVQSEGRSDAPEPEKDMILLRWRPTSRSFAEVAVKKYVLGDTVQYTHPDVMQTSALDEARKALESALASRNGQKLDSQSGALDEYLKNRNLLFFFGYSTKQETELRAKNPDKEQPLKDTIHGALEKLGSVVVATGGTANGAEGIVESYAAKDASRLPLFKALTSVARPSEISTYSNKYDLMGHFWDDLGIRAMEAARRRNTGIVFIGGGPIVAKQIRNAIALKIPFVAAINPEFGADAAKVVNELVPESQRYDALSANGLLNAMRANFPWAFAPSTPRIWLTGGNTDRLKTVLSQFAQDRNLRPRIEVTIDSDLAPENLVAPLLLVKMLGENGSFNGRKTTYSRQSGFAATAASVFVTLIMNGEVKSRQLQFGKFWKLHQDEVESLVSEVNERTKWIQASSPSRGSDVQTGTLHSVVDDAVEGILLNER